MIPPKKASETAGVGCSQVESALPRLREVTTRLQGQGAIGAPGRMVEFASAQKWYLELVDLAKSFASVVFCGFLWQIPKNAENDWVGHGMTSS